MQEQMSEKVPHCLLQKRKRSEPKDYPVRDSIQHSDSMDTICCHPCLRQQTNRRCKFSNCVLFVCVDPMILKRGWDCWIYLCTWEAHVIITFASFQLDIAQLTLHKLHHAWLTDREDDERDSRVPSRVALRQKHTTTPNLND